VATGTTNVTVTVTDGVAQAATTFTVTVTDNVAPTLATVANQTSTAGDTVSLQLVGADADSDALTYSATGLPAGLTVNTTTGVISGLLTGTTQTVTIAVSDGLESTNGTFVWTVVHPLPSRLLAYWDFDEAAGTTAGDDVGARTGTLVNGAGWTAGRTGGAVALDGADDYVAIPAFDVTGAGLTLAAWVNISSLGDAVDRPVISKATDTAEGSHYWAIGFTTVDGVARLRFRLKTGTTTTTLVATSGNLQANTWAHVAATYDGLEMRLYLNGVQVGSMAKSGVVAANAAVPVSIGRIAPASAVFPGAIDEVRIYDRGIAAGEVQLTMNGQLELPPSITNPGDRTVKAGAFTLPIVALDLQNDTLTYSATGLPTGTTINPLTGVISGTVVPGASAITVTASDGTSSSSTSFALTVVANLAPALAAPPNQMTTTDQAVTLQLAGADADADALTYSATGLPPGLTLNAATGAISGTPTAAGNRTVSITVSDGVASATRTFTWMVHRRPVVTNPGNRSVKAGPFTLPIAASDPDGGSVTYSAAGLPVGLAINPATGTISGTVTPGTSSITVTVSDGSAQSSTTWTLTVTSNSAPTLAPPGNQVTTLGDSVSLQLQGADAEKDALTFSATGLPAGLTLDAASGRISGTPVTGGENPTVSATVSDGLGTATQTFTWRINRRPVVTNPGTVMAGRGTLSFAISASDPDANVLTYAATGLPAGLAVNSTTGLISGTVAEGSSIITVTVSDGSAQTSITFALNISATAPVFAPLGDQTNDTDDNVSLAVSASDAISASGAKPMTFAAVGLPPGLTLNAGTGRITGTPATAGIGRHAVTITATDGVVTHSRSFTWKVVQVFTDDPLVPGVHEMRAVHLIELRTRIAVLRATHRLAPVAWTDPDLTAGVTARAVHIAELRSALNAVYAALSPAVPPPVYTDGSLVGLPIKAVHITELRTAIIAVE
jgi:hypothetical protein